MARAFIGTSGFDYPEWKPAFYPAELPRKGFLGYYAGRLRAVELNNTFYRIPTMERIAAWGSATPDDFRFVLKAPRKITHNERLRVPSDALTYFLKTSKGLDARLGALLFQLPPFFRCDREKLASFLDAIPREIPVAFEFRHDSWFTDAVYRTLESNGAALCIHDGDDGTTPIEVTSRFVYLRLRRSRYSPELRSEWLKRIGSWTDKGVDVYAFLKHEDNPDAPLVAVEFEQELKRR